MHPNEFDLFLLLTSPSLSTLWTKLIHPLRFFWQVFWRKWQFKQGHDSMRNLFFTWSYKEFRFVDTSSFLFTELNWLYKFCSTWSRWKQGNGSRSSGDWNGLARWFNCAVAYLALGFMYCGRKARLFRCISWNWWPGFKKMWFVGLFPFCFLRDFLCFQYLQFSCAFIIT